MKYVISTYNQDVEWAKEYSDDITVYDRSDVPKEGHVIVPNLGSDISDKFKFIIDNYDNLPEVTLFTKANLIPRFISKEEFEKVKDNTTFTPLLTMNHRTYSDAEGVVCYYKDGIYWERNDRWYLREHPTRQPAGKLMSLLGIEDMPYLPFAPGSNYIVPKANILRHPKEFYVKLKELLDWDVYPGEAQIIERSLYTLWSTT